MINYLARRIRKINEEHGFTWSADPTSTLAALMLVTTEVAEAAEEVRKPTEPDAFGLELADIIIRTLDLAACRDINIEALIERKLRINEARPYKHGKFC